VPEPESEATLSYAEIVQQVECETYNAVRKLEMEDKSSTQWARLRDWSFTIDIYPTQFLEASANLGMTEQTPKTKAGRYFQIALGGPNSSSGLNYDEYGATIAQSAYNLNVSTLFEKANSEQINSHLTCNLGPSAEAQANDLGQPGGAVNPQIPRQDFSNGVFGIYDYLQRTLAAGAPLGTEPSTMSFSKEYKIKIQAGITPGWYAPLGNTSPGVGGDYSLDDKITLTFDAPSAKPGATTKTAGRKFGTGVSEAAKNRLLMQRGLSATQQNTNLLNSLMSR
jgi:hypothetical protein